MPHALDRNLRLAAAILTAVVFVTSISIPSVAHYLNISPPVPLQDNEPNTMPTLTGDFDTISQVIYKLRRNWLERYFGLRKLLLRWESILDVRLLNSTTPFETVIAGRNEWLFLSQENPNLNVVNDYRAIAPLNDLEVTTWVKLFQERRDWLATRGIPYLLTVAPNKCTIYPEQLPMAYNRVRSKTKLDQMIDALKAGGIDVLDLREPLFETKSHHQVYYRTDSHWTPYGAFDAYQAIVTRMQRYFPALAPAQEKDFTITEEPGLLGGLAYMIALGDLYPENRIVFTPTVPRKAKELSGKQAQLNHFQPLAVYETGDPSLPRALIIRDSFAHELIPFLSEHFSHVVYVWPFPTDILHVRPFEKDLIEREKPDIVVEEFVERYFTLPPPVGLQQAAQ